MNAAAKVIHQSNVFTGHWFAMRLSSMQRILFSSMTAVLMSAIAIVYVTNEYRIALSEMENMEKQAHELRLTWGQLLLEQASLLTPSRVEALASQKLGMHIPAEQAVLVLRTK